MAGGSPDLRFAQAVGRARAFAFNGKQAPVRRGRPSPTAQQHAPGTGIDIGGRVHLLSALTEGWRKSPLEAIPGPASLRPGQ